MKNIKQRNLPECWLCLTACDSQTFIRNQELPSPGNFHSCCTCSGSGNIPKASLPLLCLVPRDGKGLDPTSSRPRASAGPSAKSDFTLLTDDCIKKHFKLPQRALYLDPFRRPLITFPMNQENSNFNLAKKTKINQMILDGTLDGSTAINAPSVFPYAKNEAGKRKDAAEEEDEIIYILQLPDWEFKCPVHNQTIRTPRFIWHSVKKSKTAKEASDADTIDGMKRGLGPMNKPKPWLLSRHTDFDLLSQW